MSGYTDLRDLGARFVPPDGPMPAAMGRTAQFTAAWSATVELLARELNMLQAEGIAIELDMEERMFRLDGLPRSDARARTDAVRISFSSKHGPLRYETGEFCATPYYRHTSLDGWQNNLRAIALSLEALRSVDRYGVSKRGEQYRGWKALPMAVVDPTDAIYDPRSAKLFLDRYGRGVEETLQDKLKTAIKSTHPDVGHDNSDDFRLVMKAKEVLGL